MQLKRKVMIHGADTRAKKLAKRIDQVFSIVGFIDRDKHMLCTSSQSSPVFSDISEYKGEYEFILCMVEDFNGLQREYIKKGVPFEKLLDFRHVHQYEKYILHQSLANEIYRRNIPGAVAELGVDFGDTAKYLNLYYADRTCYLFDTFYGFDQRDIQSKGHTQASTSELLEYYNTRSTAADVLLKMFYPNQCVIKAGYFPESLCGLEETFAFVHIDCDLYQPITEGLEYFMPNISPGGYCVVHDYYSLSYPQAKQAVQDFADRYSMDFVTDFFSDSAVFVKR